MVLDRPKKPAEDLSINCISKFEDFLFLEDDWNTLLNQNESNSVFLSHGWFKCFWDAWGNGKGLRVLVARKGSRLIGVAPLMIYTGQHLRLPAKILSFIENNECPHCGFVVPKDKACQVVPAFFDYIYANQNGWDILVLRKMPVGTSQISAIKAYCDQNKNRCVDHPSLSSPFLRTDSDWDVFYSNKSQRFKKRIRYMQNKLYKQGDTIINESHAPAQVQALMGQIYDVGERSWKAKKGNAIGSSPQNRLFFSQLPYALEPEGKVCVWLLRLNNRLIAFEYHVRQNDIIYALRSSFDEAYRAYGPGSVLDFEVVRSLFKSDVNHYDMCGGPYAHKLRWTSDIKVHVDIMVFNRRPYATLLYFLEKDIKPLLKRILESPTTRAVGGLDFSAIGGKIQRAR